MSLPPVFPHISKTQTKKHTKFKVFHKHNPLLFLPHFIRHKHIRLTLRSWVAERETLLVMTAPSCQLITYTRNNKLPLSVHKVLSNDDLLIEILLPLPVTVLLLFKSVSKRWLSLIKSLSFNMRRNQITNLDTPSGLFLHILLRRPKFPFLYKYDFVPLDIRIPINTTFTFTFGSVAPPGEVEILRSCNGLLLCRDWSKKSKNLYVYNPSINTMFKNLPEPQILNLYPDARNVYDRINLAFDPAKSPHYKVMRARQICDQDFRYFNEIQTYSSETGNWSVCSDQFPNQSFVGYEDGIYWKNAIHWLHYKDDHSLHSMLFIVDRPFINIIQTPLTVDGKMPWNRMLFESRGCLLLLCKDVLDSRHLTIYEMWNQYSKWSVKYIVNVDDIMIPFSGFWHLRSVVCFIALGEREEDSLMVMKYCEKVVQYKIVSKTLCTLCEDLGTTGDLSNCFQFIPSLANV